MGATPAYQLPYPEPGEDPDAPVQLRALAERVEAVVAGQGTVPVGVISPWSAPAAPAGWLLCDGGAISRSTYAALFGVLGTKFGAGDGSTTFNKPNLKGLCPTGRDPAQGEFDTLGEQGGVKAHALTLAQLVAHAHGVNDPGHGHGVSDPTHGHSVNDPGHAHGSSFQSFAAEDGSYQTAGGTTRQDVTGLTLMTAAYTGIGLYAAGTGLALVGGPTGISLQNDGGGGAHSNLSPYLVVGFVIKT